MDSGIDLNPPPLGLLLPEDDSFFWEGKGLRSCLGLALASSRACSFFLQNPTAWLQICNFASSGLGQPLINCSYGAMSKWPAWLEMCRSGHLAPFWAWLAFLGLASR